MMILCLYNFSNACKHYFTTMIVLQYRAYLFIWELDASYNSSYLYAINMFVIFYVFLSHSKVKSLILSTLLQKIIFSKTASDIIIPYLINLLTLDSWKLLNILMLNPFEILDMNIVNSYHTLYKMVLIFTIQKLTLVDIIHILVAMEKNKFTIVNSYLQKLNKSIVNSYNFFIQKLSLRSNKFFFHTFVDNRNLIVNSYLLSSYRNSLIGIFLCHGTLKIVNSCKNNYLILTAKTLYIIVNSYKNFKLNIEVLQITVKSYFYFIFLIKLYSQMEYWMEECVHNGRDIPPPPLAGPPPAPPPGLGTILYPRDSDHFSNSSPIEEQLAEISRYRQSNEKDGLECMKGRNYQEFRDRFQNSEKYCELCSEAVTRSRPFMKPVFHKHGSTKLYRVNAPLDHWGAYLCLSCHQSPHRVKVSMRMPILLSSSTLHNWMGRRYENGYTGDDIHCDMVTVPGATINVLKHALEAEYGLTYRPLDVLAVVGLNDLLRGHSVDRIIYDLKSLQSLVHRLAPPGEINSIAIATVLIPPKLADMQHFYNGNRLSDIVNLNFQIMELNENQQQSPLPVRFAPKFHSWGKCSSKANLSTAPRYLMENLPKHRYNQWREDVPEEMLHLDDQNRLRMGRACIGYFKALYGITRCMAPNKTAGLLLEASISRKSKRLASTQFKPRNILYSISAKERRREHYRTTGGRSRPHKREGIAATKTKDKTETSCSGQPVVIVDQTLNLPDSPKQVADPTANHSDSENNITDVASIPSDKVSQDAVNANGKDIEHNVAGVAKNSSELKVVVQKMLAFIGKKNNT